MNKLKPSTVDSSNTLYTSVRNILLHAHVHVIKVVNKSMLQAYWQIGRLIVEDEQSGLARAEYGKGVLESLAVRLREEFGKGFDVRNLRNMRAFYLAYPNRNAVRTELTWTHYRLLLRVETVSARE